MSVAGQTTQTRAAPQETAATAAASDAAPSAQYKVFLKVLREARQRAGLTQLSLAKHIGETQSFVSKCERGERRIDAIELRVFCGVFGISLKQFVGTLEARLPKAGARK